MRKAYKILILGCFSSGVLISCSVGKKYERPEIDTPDTFYGATEVALTADSIQLPWKTFFKDPKLIALIDTALVRNADFNTALKSVAQAELSLKNAKKSILPSISIAASGNRTWPSKNSLNGSLTEEFIGTKYIDDYAVSGNLSWEVPLWGKFSLQKAASNANYMATRANWVAVKTRLITQVAQGYYQLIALDAQLRIAKENDELSKCTLAMMELQFESGQINAVAVAQAKAQQKTAELLIPLYEQNITIQENALNILLGRFPQAIVRANSLAEVFPEEVPVVVPSVLLSRRPDVRAAEFSYMAANAQTGLQKAAMYPSLTIAPQYGLNSYQFDTWFDMPGSITKMVAASIAAPLFQGGKLKAAYKSALLDQQKAAIEFQQTFMTAVGEVSDALATIEGSSKRMELVTEKGTALEKASTDAVKLFNNGMVTYLDVITAQNSKLQNDLEQISIQLDQLNAFSELYRALGGGIE
ncbi:efflux transporter outer membrane subunit [Neptunitalea lumnitzerae]|uniref:RND transporter n=1 Tax=Neptunitalea lumnitzerae TaxID=2965509 RepID=A0ABQ5MJ73_9FLAO|nr:efflux transporter outer membrane subunit [Neptunitalea sp. Y10]GLB49428.1 RND transporter [Neptunitalea sp. Y10]